MEKQFIYRKTVAGRMRYGGVFLDAIAAPQAAQNGELLLVIKDEHYKSAVKVGAEYFFGRYTAKHSADMIIEVHRVYEMLDDTSDALITYAVVMALCEL